MPLPSFERAVPSVVLACPVLSAAELGKYAVIGALERLPASPYWRAEWKALGEGKNNAMYCPLTHLEQWVPCVFALTYVCGFVAELLA